MKLSSFIKKRLTLLNLLDLCIIFFALLIIYNILHKYSFKTKIVEGAESGPGCANEIYVGQLIDTANKNADEISKLEKRFDEFKIKADKIEELEEKQGEVIALTCAGCSEIS